MHSFTLAKDEVWLSGPACLQMAKLFSDETQVKFKSDDKIKELKRKMKDVKILLQISQEPRDPLLYINKYSSLNKMLRMTAYIIHFITNCKHKPEKKTSPIFAE